MSDPMEVTPPAPGAQPQEPTQTTETPAKPELTPEALRAELKEARDEAAKYRTELRAIQKAQKDQESQTLTNQGNFKELYEKAAADLKAIQGELTTVKRTNIALEFGLPPELAKRLQGDTEEELRKDAETLKALIPTVAAPSAQQSQSRVVSVPDGQPQGETDEQRRARLFGGASNFFSPQPLQTNQKIQKG